MGLIIVCETRVRKGSVWQLHGCHLTHTWSRHAGKRDVTAKQTFGFQRKSNIALDVRRWNVSGITQRFYATYVSMNVTHHNA